MGALFPLKIFRQDLSLGFRKTALCIIRWVQNLKHGEDLHFQISQYLCHMFIDREFSAVKRVFLESVPSGKIEAKATYQLYFLCFQVSINFKSCGYFYHSIFFFRNIELITPLNLQEEQDKIN